jgi:hypothetical protein
MAAQSVLEAHLDWVMLKLDIKNFYNDGDRHVRRRILFLRCIVH